MDSDRFCLKESSVGGDGQGGYAAGIGLHRLFESIWKRAQVEVTNASKISFVGLSMHDFLNPAFRFLFANRNENAAIVCATKEHEKFGSVDDVDAHSNPRSPTFKLRHLMKEICPAILGVPNRGEKQIWLDGGASVRVRETFHEFIENEMD